MKLALALKGRSSARLQSYGLERGIAPCIICHRRQNRGGGASAPPLSEMKGEALPSQNSSIVTSQSSYFHEKCIQKPTKAA